MNRFIAILFVLAFTTCAVSNAEVRERWPVFQATEWYRHQSWIVGSNYLPASAVNSLEMWQEDTFDPATIDRELGYAESLGMNTMRVFLHHLLWEQDRVGFKARISKFLDIADQHHIKTIFVLFDSCFYANPKLGPQPPPAPGVYFPWWFQGPGRDRLENTAKYRLLKSYVADIIQSFRGDSRILMWDVWNEPTPHAGRLFPGEPSTEIEKKMDATESKNKAALVEALLPQVFRWARAANPSQPLTSGIFDPTHEWTMPHFTKVERIQFRGSDVVTFHSYSAPKVFSDQAILLKALGRPVICTEYMSRPDSTIAGILPIGKRMDIGMLNWGFVDGRSQAKFPGDSWERPYIDREPAIWNQDLLKPDGSAYDTSETALIRELGARPSSIP